MCDVFVQPQFISGRYLIPDWRRAAAIDQAYDSFAVNCRGNGLAEAQILKPGLLLDNFRRDIRARVVQVEEQEIVFEACAQIVEVIALLRLLFLEYREIFGAEAA